MGRLVPELQSSYQLHTPSSACNSMPFDFEDLGIALPAQWLWDILDEFVYHYQTRPQQSPAIRALRRGYMTRGLASQSRQDIQHLLPQGGKAAEGTLCAR